ncbi:hypothetical protein TNCT_662731 [Trichonephila clavata]|uniref:Uncharacterized protein n=1 Tax=Trichonephila clavata TaxID=2740835 RepID=A0A8X6FQQ3_TRICU|nr:hypothetical protein TNCT_662731 [Trichonephila clavata]
MVRKETKCKNNLLSLEIFDGRRVKNAATRSASLMQNLRIILDQKGSQNFMLECSKKSMEFLDIVELKKLGSL